MAREIVCATVCNHTLTFTTVVIVTWLPVPVHGAMFMAPSCRSGPRGDSAQLPVPTLYSFKQDRMERVSLLCQQWATKVILVCTSVFYLARQCRSVLRDVKLRINSRQVPVEVPTAKTPLEPQTLCDVRTLRLHERKNN